MVKSRLIADGFLHVIKIECIRFGARGFTCPKNQIHYLDQRVRPNEL